MAGGAFSRLDLAAENWYDREKSADSEVIMEKQLTARQRQALEMRSRIQAVALDLFDKESFEAVSV